jgi:hypothetical protein
MNICKVIIWVALTMSAVGCQEPVDSSVVSERDLYNGVDDVCKDIFSRRKASFRYVITSIDGFNRNYNQNINASKLALGLNIFTQSPQMFKPDWGLTTCIDWLRDPERYGYVSGE